MMLLYAENRYLKAGRPRPVEIEITPGTLAQEVNIDLLEPGDYPRPAAACDLIRSQEPATAIQYGINAVVVVFNDNACGNVMRVPVNRFQGRTIGVDLHL